MNRKTLPSIACLAFVLLTTPLARAANPDALVPVPGHVLPALARSAAVAPQYQGCGIGSRLTKRLLERATSDGVERVVLLTSTASEFFARHFGFCETPRSAFDSELAASSEWNLPRCSSAVCMSLALK